jgi:hypothetical protein
VAGGRVGEGAFGVSGSLLISGLSVICVS